MPGSPLQPITNIIEHENWNITFDFCKNESDAIEDNNVENGIYLDGNELYILNRSKVYSITGILIGETKGENIPMNLEKGIYIVINNRINKKIIIQWTLLKKNMFNNLKSPTIKLSLHKDN